MSHDNEFDTTVLTDDYDDFQDTVVDQVIAFDPALFQSAPTASASATTSPVGTATPPAAHNPEEDTWVLGSQPSQPVARSSAGFAPAEPVAAPTAAFTPASTAGAGAQRPSSTWQQVPRTTPAMMSAADSAPARTNPALIGVIVGLAIVGIVAIVVAIAFALAPQESSRSVSNAPAVVAVPSSSSSSASAAAAAPEPEPEAEKSAGSSYKQGTGSSKIVSEGNGRALSEAELYALLSDYYELAGDYDASVRSCAGDFNDTFLKEDKSARNAKASAAASLKVKIKSSWDELKKVELPFMSKNTQAYRDLCECYECLWRRVDVIDQAWKIDLQYDKPKEHEDEIVAPLRAQQANGNDKYYTRFKDLYPTVTLVKP